MTWTLVEPCAGSAALALHLLGARRALLPYQGSKWRVRHHLQRHAEALGFCGPPSRVLLTDPGPWGRTLPVVFNPALRSALIDRLRALANEDPAAVFARLQGAAVPKDAVDHAAEHLWLQRLAFSGKAVGVAGGRWASPGLNRTSAYGVPATGRFGAVGPMVPSLIRVIEGYGEQLADARVDARCSPALQPQPWPRTLVYLDPPYAGSTRYPDGRLEREEVVALALAWHRAGAAVIVSESAGLGLPGWTEARIGGRSDASPFRGQQHEWVTVSPAARDRARSG